MIVSNKFILIYSVSVCIISIAQTIIAIEQKNLKPHFVIEVNGIDEDPFNDFKCGKGYFSRISYIENVPKSLSNEEYAEKILNLENSLNLPTELKSDKTEILNYLETKNNKNKQKRQLPDSYHYGYEKSNYDVVITVTVYGKEQDVIIIKEVIPNNNSDRDRYNVETELPLTTTTTEAPSPIRHRQPDYTVIGNWYPTLRTVHVHSSNTEYDQHPTEMTTTSTTSRPFNWGGWGWNNHVTTTNTPTTSQPTYWSTPETTKSTWDLREYTTETTSSDTDYESETISSTTKSSQSSWGWFFSPDKSTTTTTTTTESSEPNYEYQTTSSYPVYNYWDTTTVPSTTTTTTIKTLLSGWPFSPFSDRAESTTEKSMMTTTTEYNNNYWDYIAPSTTSATTTTTTTTTTESSADLTTTTKKFSFFNIFG